VTNASSTLNSGESHPRSQRAWYFAITLLFFCGMLVAQSRLRDWGRIADPRWLQPAKSGLNAPFITTPDPVVDKMVELGNITESDLVYDLGCGDGRLVITAAMKSGCRGIGFDIDPQRVTEATENARLHEVDTLVTIRQDDVFKVDLSEADVILMYLLPWMLEDMIPQFDKCRPGTRLVSHDFQIKGIVADRTEQVPVSETSTHLVHLYHTPLKREPPPLPRRRPKSSK
jgi:SAM-dependent methyltransferase